MEANNRENGMVMATMRAARTFPRNSIRMIVTRMKPSRQIVQHRMRGEAHQIAAIDERNDLHAGRQDVIVQFLNFLVNALAAPCLPRRPFAGARCPKPHRRYR